MTRDEAIERARNAWEGPASSWEALVDLLVSFGLLKLEEPKNAEERLKDELEMIGYGTKAITAAIDRAGLKLVEK